jgi:hypothetical protein
MPPRACGYVQFDLLLSSWRDIRFLSTHDLMLDGIWAQRGWSPSFLASVAFLASLAVLASFW